MAGTGEIDHGLVSLLPLLKSYTAVDPDAGALDTVKGRLEEFTTIKVRVIECCWSKGPAVFLCVNTHCI